MILLTFVVLVVWTSAMTSRFLPHSLSQDDSKENPVGTGRIDLGWLTGQERKEHLEALKHDKVT